MTKKSRAGLIYAKLVLIALIAGVAAGAVAVYVKNTLTGNGTKTASAQQCETAAKTAETLRPLATGEVAAFVVADEPRPMTDLNFRDQNGETSLSAFRGKTVLMNLWATWCVPCREEMPALDALERELGSDVFEVVAVNIDTGSDEKPVSFMDEIGIQSLAFYRDETMKTFNTLKKDGLAFGLPATLLIDENGCLLGSMNGPAEWASEDAKTLVSKALSSDSSN
ncbi:thiol:disulfide interchange protein TlpA [Martelella mediterranea]|uniref:Thiol-disulfide isomerase/thioredoxin n=1 Tax=Martelella mediterranea TaxID=293089 RepID=A0A4R3NXP8_9HYPH|nr:TlpA disulfide reductase family protein [Martelella mediterranea]TCT39088.1 thiol-disulfide isomerase/thioredoxin [Martelella mediterranea]